MLELSYDALGRRVESIDYTGVSDPCGDASSPVVTHHVYAGLETLEEHVWCDDGQSGSEWRLAREFLWGDRFPEPLALIDHTDAGDLPATGSPGGGPEPLHYLHDALGSVVALTDSSGVVVERYAYDPYGPTYIEDPTTGDRRDASAYGNPFAWTGQRYDAGVNLYHFPFRSYSPRLGRWLQRDPLGYVDGVNLYEYARSMPTFFIDPLGLYVPPGGGWGPGGLPTCPWCSDDGDDDDGDDEDCPEEEEEDSDDEDRLCVMCEESGHTVDPEDLASVLVAYGLALGLGSPDDDAASSAASEDPPADALAPGEGRQHGSGKNRKGSSLFSVGSTGGLVA